MMRRRQRGYMRLAAVGALLVAATLAVIPASVEGEVSAPGRPGKLSLSQDGGHVILQWTAPSGGGPFDGHRIWRRAQGETEAAVVLEVNGPDLFAYDSTPWPGIAYSYEVQAFGPGGDGERSPAVSISTHVEEVRGGFLVRNSEGRRQPFALSRTTESPVLFDIRYSGTDQFKVFLVDSEQHGGKYQRLLTPAQLFGVYGPYEGIRALSYRDGMFEGQDQAAGAFNVRVEGDGAWEVRVSLPDFGAPPVTVAEGSGDSVVGPWTLRSPNPFVADFHFAVTHQGREFSARLIASDGTVRTLVPQQIAAFADRKATVNVFAPWNPDKGADDLHYDDYALDIQADGEWSIRLINPAPAPAPRVEGIPLGRVLGTYTGFENEELLHGIAYADIPSSPVLFDIGFRGGSRGPRDDLGDGDLRGELAGRGDADHHDRGDGRCAIRAGRGLHGDAGDDHLDAVVAAVGRHVCRERHGDDRGERPDHHQHQRPGDGGRGRRDDGLHSVAVAVGRHTD